MLTEIVDILKLAYEIISDKKSKKRDGKYIFELYRNLDRIITIFHRVVQKELDRHYFVNRYDTSVHLKDNCKTSEDFPLDKWVSAINNDLKDLQKEISSFFFILSKIQSAIEVYDPILFLKLHYHFYFKSRWLRLTYEMYNVGEISGDGSTLNRKYLKLADSIEKYTIDYYNQYERKKIHATIEEHIKSSESPLEVAKIISNELFFPQKNNFLDYEIVEEKIDISKDDIREQLFEQGYQNVYKLELLKENLRKFISKNISISEIL